MLSHVPGVSEREMDWCTKENVLDAPYYHVVFTVPEELNPIIIAIRNFCMMHCIMLHHPLWTSWRKIQSIWELTSDISVFFIHGVLQWIIILISIQLFLVADLIRTANGKIPVGSFSPVWGHCKSVPWEIFVRIKSLWNDSRLEFHGTAEKYQNHYCFKGLLDECYKKTGLLIVRKHLIEHSQS